LERVILKAGNIHRAFISGERRLDVLSGVDLTVYEGYTVAIVGASGSGKSTLLQILGGLDAPDAGTVAIDGEDLYSLPDRRLSVLRNESIGFVFQFHRLLSDFNALENIMIPGLIRGDSKHIVLERARDLLDTIGLYERMYHHPSELSGGEQQRVAVARALVNEPRIVLADEPSGNLDPTNARHLEDIMWELVERNGTSLIVVTHDERLATRADTTLTLLHGSLEA